MKNSDSVKMQKAVLTVLGSDRVGIIAEVATYLAGVNVNILDITQTTMDEIFTMIMLVDITNTSVSFDVLVDELSNKGKNIGLEIQIRHVDIFDSMHKI